MSKTEYESPYKYEPIKWSSLFEEQARFEVDVNAVVVEMSRRVIAIEETVLREMVVERLRELGYTVIALKPDVVLAFKKLGAGNKGTQHTIDLANKAGIPVIEYWEV